MTRLNASIELLAEGTLALASWDAPPGGCLKRSGVIPSASGQCISLNHSCLCVPEILCKLWDFSKIARNFRNASRSGASLKSRVWAPRGTVLRRGLGRRAPLAAPCRDATRVFPKRFRGSFRASLEGMFSKNIMSVMAKELWKLWNLRNRPQTYEISFARMLHSSRSSGLPGVLCS